MSEQEQEKHRRGGEMVRLEGGRFVMGSEKAYAFPNEKPEHEVRISAFEIDRYPVTNREYQEFVEETGYVTVAERVIDWEELQQQLPPGTPKPAEEALAPGALVFRMTKGPVDLRRMDLWWIWVPGASWKHPEGPESHLEGRWEHPVVQVAWEDAVEYAKWAGKRLPTEAEWEYACRGGLKRKRFAWGEEERPDGKIMLNRWNGNFPYYNSLEDGFATTSPAGSFPPNAYGLYDMGGNVWNWCHDVYHGAAYQKRAGKGCCCDPRGPRLGENEIFLPGDPSPQTVPGTERRVMKGGSFLCHPAYCESYRPSARRGTTPDTATNHIGFRCVQSLLSKNP